MTRFVVSVYREGGATTTWHRSTLAVTHLSPQLMTYCRRKRRDGSIAAVEKTHVTSVQSQLDPFPMLQTDSASLTVITWTSNKHRILQITHRLHSLYGRTPSETLPLSLSSHPPQLVPIAMSCSFIRFRLCEFLRVWLQSQTGVRSVRNL